MIPAHEALLRQRKIQLRQIDYESSERLTDALDYLNALDEVAPVLLLIDCDGGTFHPQLQMIDTISNSVAPVYGIVQGVAISAAFNVLQFCKKRYAFPNARLTYHMLGMGQARPNQPNFERFLKCSYEYHKRLMPYFAKRSGQSVESWEKWAAEDEEFNGMRAKELGIVDNIIMPSDSPWR